MINTLHLMGYLGGEPRFHQFANGGTVANISIPWSKRRNVNGEWVETTYWFDVDIWSERTVQRLQEKFNQGEFGKGDLVYVEGEVIKEDYSARNGQQGSKLKMRAFNVRMIPRKRAQCENCGHIPQRNQNYQNGNGNGNGYGGGGYTGQPQQPNPYGTGTGAYGNTVNYGNVQPQQPYQNPSPALYGGGMPQQQAPVTPQYPPQQYPPAPMQAPVQNGNGGYPMPQQQAPQHTPAPMQNGNGNGNGEYPMPQQQAPVAPQNTPQQAPQQYGDMNGGNGNGMPHNPAPQNIQNQNQPINPEEADDLEDLPW